jgi:PAS domain S-box-containing protein
MLRSLSCVLAVAGGSVGLLVLVGGWILGFSPLLSIIPGAASMKVNTALGLMLTASAILLNRGPRSQRRLAQLCAALVILISLATLIEDISGWNLGIDQFLMADRTPPVLVTAPGRMAVATAVSLLLLGGALFSGNRPRGLLWSQLFALSAAVLCLVNLVGYIYGFNFAGIAFHTAMAVHTASSLLILSVAILFSRPSGVMTPVTSESLGGVLTRNLLPAAVVAPVLLGWVTSQGELHGLYGPLFSDALLATSYIVVFACLIWAAGRRLTGMEAEKGQATALLRAREELLSMFVKHVPASVAMLDRDMRYLQVSDRWCVDYGPESSQMLGRSHYEMFPDIPERWKEIHRRCLAGETLRSEEDQWDRADGSANWLRWEIRPWGQHDKLPEGILIFSEDITERKRTENMLRGSEATTRALLETAAQAILAVDTSGSIAIANRMAGEMFGFGPNELLGKPAELLIPHRLRARFEAHRAKFAANLRPRPVGTGLELVGLRKDGSEFPVEINLSRVSTVGGLLTVSFVSDITERKRTDRLREELQRERERSAEARGMARGMERFRLSFEEAPVGMALIRGDGVWLRVNRALCEMTGYTEVELIARARDITHPDDRAEESRLLSRVLSGELAAGRREERFVHQQGHTIYVSVNFAVVERDEAGHPVHFVAHVQDLTERRRAERELEASRAQMVSSSRLSALGMMAGGIAHEINNPLTVIHASAANISRMAESGSVQLPTVLKNCNRISQTADRISRIVLSLRHVAREGSADEFRETPVREIVEETLELCAERFRAHNIRLAVSAVDPEAVINCREAQICQVLLNLLQNAFDELVDREGERWVTVEVKYCPGWVVLSVSDSGRGISPEHRAHIMEPFFTTKPVGKGIGLGLSISRSIALEHGGTLELDEESPHTCFRLNLPLSERA